MIWEECIVSQLLMAFNSPQWCTHYMCTTVSSDRQKSMCKKTKQKFVRSFVHLTDKVEKFQSPCLSALSTVLQHSFINFPNHIVREGGREGSHPSDHLKSLPTSSRRSCADTRLAHAHLRKLSWQRCPRRRTGSRRVPRRMSGHTGSSRSRADRSHHRLSSIRSSTTRSVRIRQRVLALETLRDDVARHGGSRF
jgi:hypothetical protein